MFKSSDEAAIYLAELCKKNNWNYIYKPHPMMMECFVEEVIPHNTIFADNVDINDLIDLADVVVTIVSTVSYNALIRKKKVLMLGYTQLKNKECTYEAFEKEQIESELKKAIMKEKQEFMENKFILHVAQISRYYSKEGV